MAAQFRKTRKAAQVQVRPSGEKFFEGSLTLSTVRKETAAAASKIMANNKNTPVNPEPASANLTLAVRPRKRLTITCSRPPFPDFATAWYRTAVATVRDLTTSKVFSVKGRRAISRKNAKKLLPRYRQL
jgi:hypothetical protein